MPTTPFLSSPTAAAAMATTSKETTTSLSTSSSSSSLLLLRKAAIFFINTLLCLSFALFGMTYLIRYVYENPITELQESYKLRPDDGDTNGFHNALNDDVTYYNRQCTGPEDISTHSAADLMVPVEVSRNNTREFQKQVRDISMTHGALLVPNVLQKDTAQTLRDYLETNYHALDVIPWSANFWSSISRLSLGLTIDKYSHRDDILVQALQEVGNNDVLQHSLEAMLGPNPAIVELSTLTTMYGAKRQGIHTDSDYFGSSLLYSRTFLHSYTMFIALQDTTPRMGATTICPGTHMCANQDLKWLCGEDSIHTFEASSNGKTGKDDGLFLQGDAFLFNQNIWHRGPANQDPNHVDTNRVMFIMTFVSRRDFDKVRDTRQLGWGTYYYMRWDQWGHTFQDIKHHAADRFTTWGTGSLRALGLYFEEFSLLGYTWVEHFARQIAHRVDFYKKGDLKKFKGYLIEMGVPDYLRGNDEDTIHWDPYLREMMDNAVEFTKKLEWSMLGMAGVLYAIIFYACQDDDNVNGTTKNRNDNNKNKKSFKAIPAVSWLLLGHVMVAVTGYTSYQAILTSYLGEKITSGKIWDTAFPQASTDLVTTLPTTLPDRMDYLVGTRFDAPFLGSYNDFLDYHPGNKDLNKLLKKVSTLFPLELAEQSIRQLWRDVPIQGVVPRMLLQDYATGYWGVMKNEDEEEEKIDTMIRKLVLAQQSPLINALWTSLKEVLADARFGHSRETAMGRVVTPKIVEHWQNVIFTLKKEERKSSNYASTSLISMPTMIKRTIATVAKKPQTTSSNTLPIQTTARNRCRHLQSKRPNQEAPTTSTILKEGDRVLVTKKGSKKTTQLEGVIRYIHHNNAEKCLVQFSLGGTGKARFVSKDDILPYRSLAEGDRVKVAYYVKGEGGNIKNNKKQKWYSSKILLATPFDTYLVQSRHDENVVETVTRDQIILLKGSSAAAYTVELQLYRGPGPDVFTAGQTVFADYNQSGKWYTARILSLEEDGISYYIEFNDGDSAHSVPRESLLPMHNMPLY